MHMPSYTQDTHAHKGNSRWYIGCEASLSHLKQPNRVCEVGSCKKTYRVVHGCKYHMYHQIWGWAMMRNLTEDGL